jgi:hypothetical protein
VLASGGDSGGHFLQLRTECTLHFAGGSYGTDDCVRFFAIEAGSADVHVDFVAFEFADFVRFAANFLSLRFGRLRLSGFLRFKPLAKLRNRTGQSGNV